MEKPIIKDPRGVSTQTLLSDRLQLGDILTQLLNYIGPSRLVVTTFSTGEEFLRRLLSLKKSGLVTSATLYLDTKAAQKTARTLPMLRGIFDEINYCENHSKVILLDPQVGPHVTLFSSQNMTRGNRMESYVIFGYCTDWIYEPTLESIRNMRSCGI